MTEPRERGSGLALFAVVLTVLIWVSFGYYCGFSDARRTDVKPWSKHGAAWMNKIFPRDAAMREE